MLQYNPTVTGSLQVSGDITGTVNGINITGLSQSVSTQLITVQASTGSSDAKFETLSGVTSSALTRLTNIETKSASVDISISNINTFTSSNANQSLNSKTGSYATTGSNTFFGTQVFSGSVFIANNLTVQGSSSIQYISASSVSIGTNIVQLNTANPSVRFAGLTIIDSGSIGGSGSFLYDSVHDEFIFVHRGNGTNVTSSHFVLGPETYDSLGNETYLTCNRIPKGTGKEHLIDSNIFDNGSKVGINTTTPLADSTFESLGYNLFRENATSAHSWFPYTDGSVYISARTGSSIIFREYNDNCIKVAMTITSSNVSIGRTDTMYRLNISHDVPKTCTTARGLAFFGSNDSLASAPFGLVITSQGGATISNRVVRIGTTDFGSANGGLLELNGTLFVCNSGNVGMGKAPISYQNYRYLNIFGGSPTNGGIVRLETCDSSYVHEIAVDNSGGYLSSSSNFQIYVANSSRLYIKSNGNLGISTQDPILPLHVNSATGDYNTIFSTSCVCGRAGWVIARPGTTSAIASGLVLISDCSFRFGTNSYYHIKMLQDGSTSILNGVEGEALKVTVAGQVSIACNLEIGNGYLSISAGSGLAYSSRISTVYSFPYINTFIDSIAGTSYASQLYFRTNSGGGAMVDNMVITCGGCIYIGKGWGATNHRINLEKPQGCTILVISGYSGANNDSVVISAASGTGYNGALTVMGVTTNTSTGRSISAGGSITGGGNDYAEYIVKRQDSGCIQKGQIAGIDSCKLLTDKWSLANSFVIKSTDPSFVGGDSWDKHIGNRPQQTTCITDEEFAPILAEYESKLEEARNKVDRIAFSGQVPVIVSGSYNVGDYILPIEGPDDTIIGVACSLSNLTLDDYGKTVGRVWGTCLDKAWVAVKIG